MCFPMGHLFGSVLQTKILNTSHNALLPVQYFVEVAMGVVSDKPTLINRTHSNPAFLVCFITNDSRLPVQNIPLEAMYHGKHVVSSLECFLQVVINGYYV